MKLFFLKWMCHVCICLFLQALVVVNMCSVSRPDSMTLSWPAITKTLQKNSVTCYVCHWRLGDLSQGCCQVRIFLLYQCVYITLWSTYYRTYPQGHCVYNVLAYIPYNFTSVLIALVLGELEAYTLARGDRGSLVCLWWLLPNGCNSTHCFLEYVNPKSSCVYLGA